MSGPSTPRPQRNDTPETAMDSLFHRWQKKIMLVIAALVILSFALVWDTPMSPSGGGGDYVVGKMNNKKIHANEHHAFIRRIRNGAGADVQLLIGRSNPPYGQRLMMGYQPNYLPDADQRWLSLHALADLARRQNVDVSDYEVGQWLRLHHPVLNRDRNSDQPLDDAEFKRRLGILAREMSTNEREIVAGAREWLILRRFIELDSATRLESPETLYAYYASNNTDYTYARQVFAPDDTARDDARAAWAALDNEKQRAEIQRLANAHRYEEAFWEPSAWRVEYLLIPFAAAPEPAAPKAEDVDQLRAADPALRDKPHAEGYAEAVRRLENAARRRWVHNTLQDVVMPKIRERAPADAENRPSLEELAADPAFADLGLKTGRSGDAAASIDELVRLPAFAKEGRGGLADLLRDADKAVRDGQDEHAQRLIGEYIGFTTPPGGYLPPSPVESTDGFLVVRVMEHRPTARKALDAGKPLDDAVTNAARTLWVDENVHEKVRAQAAELIRTLTENPDAPMPEGAEEIVLPLYQVQARGELNALRWGQVTPQPVPVQGQPDAFEVLRLINKRMPAPGDLAQLPENERRPYEGAAITATPGSVLYNYDYQCFDVAPGSVLMYWLAKDFDEGRLQLAPREAAPADEHGDHDASDAPLAS